MHHLTELIETIFQALHSGQLPQLGFWTYILLTLLVSVEGHLGTLTGTVAATLGMMNPAGVFAAGMLGSLAGDSFWFLLGWLGKMDWFLRLGRRLGVQPSTLEGLKAKLLGRAPRIMFLAVLTVTMVIPALFTAGLVKVPWRRWFPAVFAAEVLWNGFIVGIGFFARQGIDWVEDSLEFVAWAGGVVFFIVLIIAIPYIIKALSRQKSAPGREDDGGE